MATDAKNLAPKEQRALKYLRSHKYMTSDDGRSIGDGRLSDTIMRLRRKGYDIETIRVDIVNRYGENTWYGKYILKDE